MSVDLWSHLPCHERIEGQYATRRKGFPDPAGLGKRGRRCLRVGGKLWARLRVNGGGGYADDSPWRRYWELLCVGYRCERVRIEYHFHCNWAARRRHRQRHPRVRDWHQLHDFEWHRGAGQLFVDRYREQRLAHAHSPRNPGHQLTLLSCVAKIVARLQWSAPMEEVR